MTILGKTLQGEDLYIGRIYMATSYEEEVVYECTAEAIADDQNAQLECIISNSIVWQLGDIWHVHINDMICVEVIEEINKPLSKDTWLQVAKICKTWQPLPADKCNVSIGHMRSGNAYELTNYLTHVYYTAYDFKTIPGRCAADAINFSTASPWDSLVPAYDAGIFQEEPTPEQQVSKEPCPECLDNPSYYYEPFFQPGIRKRACSLCKGNAIIESNSAA